MLAHIVTGYSPAVFYFDQKFQTGAKKIRQRGKEGIIFYLYTQLLEISNLDTSRGRV